MKYVYLRTIATPFSAESAPLGTVVYPSSTASTVGTQGTATTRGLFLFAEARDAAGAVQVGATGTMDLSLFENISGRWVDLATSVTLSFDTPLEVALKPGVYSIKLTAHAAFAGTTTQALLSYKVV